MPIRGRNRSEKIHNEAKALMKKGYSNRDAHGVATRIVTGRGPKKGHKMPKRKKGRKKYGEKHMERGLSYANAPQGYYSASGKPKGSYGKPANGYIDQTGMPNASRTRKALMHMSSYYGKGAAGNPGAHYGTSSTNAGTSPNPGSMDPTYKAGKRSKRGKYR